MLLGYKLLSCFSTILNFHLSAMEKFLILTFLLACVLANDYPFGNLTIHTTLASYYTFSNSTSDTCRKLIIRNSTLQHLSSEQMYIKSAIGTLDKVLTSIDFQTLNISVVDFDSDDAEGKLIFNTKNPPVSRNYIYALDQSNQIISNTSQDVNSTPSKVFLKSNTTFYFSGNAFQMGSTLSSYTSNFYPLIPSYEGIAVAPNYKFAVLWNSTGYLMLYNFTGKVSEYTLANAPGIGITSVAFSLDSSLAVVETDAFNPITIFSLPKLTVVNTVSINDSLASVQFLDSNSTKLVAFGSKVVVFVDLQTNFTYPTLTLSGVVFGADQQNNIFACYKNGLSQYSISFVTTPTNTTNATNTTAPSSNSTNATNTTAAPSNTTNATNTTATPSNTSAPSNTTNTTTPSNTTNPTSTPSNTTNSTNGTANSTTNGTNAMATPSNTTNPSTNSSSNSQNSSPQPTNSSRPQPGNTTSLMPENNTTNSSKQLKYYQQTDLSVLGTKGQQVFQQISQTLNQTTAAVTVVTQAMVNSPITIYFLGFLNFVSISSLYIFLNFQIPQQIYNYLAFLQNQLSINVLNAFNINLTVPQYSDQKVSSEKAIYFGVTSDLLSGNYQSLIIFSLTVFVMLFLLGLFTTFLSKSNIVRALYTKDFKYMLYGQIIGLIQPFVLPWTFILLKNGVLNICTWANQVAYIFVFFFCTAFTIFFLLELLINQSNRMSFERKKKSQKASKKGNLKFLQELLTKKVPFLSLFSKEVLWEWFLCLTNFLPPLLVLLQSASVFIVIMAFHQAAGVMICSKGPQRSINEIILSLYPLLFHICFMIFFWSSSQYVIACTQLVCLVVLFLGLIHNMITIVIQIGYFLYKLIIFSFRSSKVEPIIQPLANISQKQKRGAFNQYRIVYKDNTSKIQNNSIIPLYAKRDNKIPKQRSQLVEINESQRKERQKNLLKDQIQSKLQLNQNKVTVKRAKASIIIDQLRIISNNRRSHLK